MLPGRNKVPGWIKQSGGLVLALGPCVCRLCSRGLKSAGEEVLGSVLTLLCCVPLTDAVLGITLPDLLEMGRAHPQKHRSFQKAVAWI